MAKQEPVPITGVWVRRDFAHLGGKLRVLVEVGGEWRLVQEHDDEPGPHQSHISHITEPAGILSAPVVES